MLNELDWRMDGVELWSLQHDTEGKNVDLSVGGRVLFILYHDFSKYNI